MIYLDNAATSFPKPDSVISAVTDYMTHHGASIGRGGYDSAIYASDVLGICQEEVASLFSIPSPERIVFTKNATEAINCAIFGLLSPGDEMIVSSMEHNAVMRAAHEASRRGVKLKIASALPSGKVLPERIESLISDKTRLIVMIHASNVTGGINDIYAVQKIAAAHRIFALFDLSQSAGVIPITASDLDMIALPGHKALLGPMGTGVLYVRENININPLLFGGTGSLSESASMPDIFPDRFHAGTVNIAALAGLTEGVRFIKKEGVYEKEKETINYLISSLSEIKSLRILGDKERSGIVSVTIPNFDCVTLSEKLSSLDICTRAGLHCAPMAHRTIGTFPSGTLRFSPGFFTTKADIDTAVTALKKISEN